MNKYIDKHNFGYKPGKKYKIKKIYLRDINDLREYAVELLKSILIAKVEDNQIVFDNEKTYLIDINDF